MKRQDKYVETETFRFYNANPKGRLGDDCVIRAISTFLGMTWEQCYRELAEVGIKHGFVLNDPKAYVKYLELKGYKKQSQPRKEDNTKYTGSEFCQELTLKNKVYLVSMAHHLSVIVEGKIHDTWDCSGKTIGNYWVK